MKTLMPSAASFVLSCLGGAAVLGQTDLRGWHEAGQTWLVWKETEPAPESYRIFSSERQFDDLSEAEMIGRTFPREWQTARLRLADKGLTWTIPDGKGGRYTLEPDEVLFVSTPHLAGSRFFAVVEDGSAEVGPKNWTGRICQGTDPVQCHLQASGSERGQAYRIYAHWIDGQDNWNDSRPDYPVMGNEHFNGAAAVFRVWDPRKGRPQGLVPAVVELHGGGRIASFARMNLCWGLSDGLAIALDDRVAIRSPEGIGTARTYWFGYWEGYDPFILAEHQPVPHDGVIVDYTMRRVDWTLGWLVEHEGIDPHRISVVGFSMGGRGTLYNTRRHPERYAAATAYCPGIAPFETDILVGNRSQNLRTNLPGSPTVAEVFNPAVVISETQRDMVYTRIVVGRNDRSAGAGWSLERVEQFKDLNTAGFGHHLYWDERSHGDWKDGHWHWSPKLWPRSLTRYRKNQSFPAFFNNDQDPNLPGRQPEIGNGDPADGDPWGTWAGYYDWDLGTIEDTPSHWAATVYVVISSRFANDIPPFDSATVHIAVRRPQKFAPAPGSALQWSFVGLFDSRVRQSGTATVDANGVVIVPSLTIYKTPCRLTISRSPATIKKSNSPGE